MKKILSLFALFSVATFSSIHATVVWKTGYVVLTTGDSLKGDIHVNTTKELALFSKVMLKVGETTKTYKPEQVKEYGFETEHFVAKTIDGELQFVKVISMGRINLYELQFEVQRGNELAVDSDYYIEKNDGTNAGPQKVKSNKFKKTVAELMADNSSLVSRVQNDDKKYEIAEMTSVVNEYNSWYTEQNGSMQGSR